MGNTTVNADHDKAQSETKDPEIEHKPIDVEHLKQMKLEIDDILDNDKQTELDYQRDLEQFVGSAMEFKPQGPILLTEAERNKLKGMKSDIDDLLDYQRDLEQLVADQAMPIIPLLDPNIALIAVDSKKQTQQMQRRSVELKRNRRIRADRANDQVQTIYMPNSNATEADLPAAKDNKLLVERLKQQNEHMTQLKDNAKQLAEMYADLQVLQQEQEDDSVLDVLPSSIAALSQVVPFKCKEGWLHKQSKHLNMMRKRWTVLQRVDGARYTLCTYAEYKTYENATEEIQLDQHVVVEAKNLSTDSFILYNQISKEKFVFQAASSEERDSWIKALKKCNAQL